MLIRYIRLGHIGKKVTTSDGRQWIQCNNSSIVGVFVALDEQHIGWAFISPAEPFSIRNPDFPTWKPTITQTGIRIITIDPAQPQKEVAIHTQTHTLKDIKKQTIQKALKRAQQGVWSPATVPTEFKKEYKQFINRVAKWAHGDKEHPKQWTKKKKQIPF